MSDRRETVLITGISGFIAKHCARELLAHGYRVRGTVRGSGKADAVRAGLSGHVDVGGLDVVSADLTDEAGWPEAMAGVDHVLHTASPFPIAQPKDHNALIRPAVDGTVRVFRAAAAAGVRTFVHTSSMVAVYPGHDNRRVPYTDGDWAVIDSDEMTAYALSKTLAERTARDMMAKDKPGFRYASVNPGLVLGPLVDDHAGASAEVIALLLKGRLPAVPRVHLPVVDARDVARMHRLAIEKGRKGGRYLAVADSLWMRQVAAILRQGLGERARKVPRGQMPDLLVRLAGVFDAQAAAAVPQLGRTINVDTARARSELGIAFIPAERAVTEMGKALVQRGLA